MASETTAERWAGRVAEWRASGLTAKEFCEGRDFNAGGLHHWASLLKRRGASADAAMEAPGPSVRLVEVRTGREDIANPPSSPSLPPATLTITLGAARIAVPSGFDGATLRVVLDALVRAKAGVAQ